MKRLFVFFVPIVMLPTFAFAQVVINEVMYNPQGSDSGREWVELYNEGTGDVTMTGGSVKGSWRISDGSNHTLTDPAGGTGRGALTIPAGGYLVVASDPSEFLSGEYAGGSYSVVKSSISLSNNGTTLSLLDGSGAPVDSVTYAPSQGGNDDGSSLQRQADGSWIAALPTPGASNSNVTYVAPVQNDVSGGQQTDQQPASTTDQSTGQPQTPTAPDSYIAPPAPSLYADAGSDRTVIVGADVEFDANAYNNTQTLLDPSTVRFMWNFGDGSSAEGTSVLHHFSYPGRYAVVLTLASDRNAAQAQITVTAQPAALSLALLSDGGIEIHNSAGHALDLSDWIVREDQGPFAAQFMLPDDSKLLSGSSMNIPPQTLAFRASSSTFLEYPNGIMALAMGQGVATTSAPVTQQVDTPVAIQAAPATKTAPIKAVDTSSSTEDVADSDTSVYDENMDGDMSDTTTIATSTVLEAAAVTSDNSNYLWWIGVTTLVIAVAAGLVAALHFKKHEWDIVDDTAE